MVRLSANVNKIATLRNSRGGNIPNLCHAVRVILDAGCKGITVHPRADQRHITTADVEELAEMLAPYQQSVEFNIEGEPSPAWIDMVKKVRPHQCTLVPVVPGEITSSAGWSSDIPPEQLQAIIRPLKDCGIRVSVFVDPEKKAIEWAAKTGADRIELYTEPYAAAFQRDPNSAITVLDRFTNSAKVASDLGLGINAGHDLDLSNLPDFLQAVPSLIEVSIGHALISRAVFVGLRQVVKEYLAILD